MHVTIFLVTIFLVVIKKWLLCAFGFLIYVFALNAYGFNTADAVLKPSLLLPKKKEHIRVIRGPYLQMAGHNRMTIRWRTNKAVDSRVIFGLSRDHLINSVNGDALVVDHEITLKDLKPLTRYYYSVGSVDYVLFGDSETYFETSPKPGERVSTRIWVIGDSGTADKHAQSVYQAYAQKTGDSYTDQWIMLGDNAYNNGTDEDYQDAVFEIYPSLLKQTPLWSTLGNHDGYSASSAKQSGVYYDIFSFPKRGEFGGVASGTEAYYSYTYGNIHFIVLDSYDSNRLSGGDMLKWLEADLQSVTSDWVIAYWHHPPYSKGSHDSDVDAQLIQMRQNTLPILDRYEVDLVFSGHSHSYERSMLISGHYGASSTFNHTKHVVDQGRGAGSDGPYQKLNKGISRGTIYTVAGSSGKVSRRGRLDHPVMSQVSRTLGSVILTIDGLTLNSAFIDAKGLIVDSFTINKID